jgi:hypothetical protein
MPLSGASTARTSHKRPYEDIAIFKAIMAWGTMARWMLRLLELGGLTLTSGGLSEQANSCWRPCNS